MDKRLFGVIIFAFILLIWIGINYRESHKYSSYKRIIGTIIQTIGIIGILACIIVAIWHICLG